MVEEGKYSSFWFIVRFLGLLLCQIFELLERKYQQYYSHSVTSTTTAINSNKDDSHSRQDDYDLNIIQFIQLNSYQISFSYKRSFGSWLWNSFASSYLKIQQLYSSNCQQNKMKFLELRISNDVQSLYHDIDKNFLSKIFSKNILLDWYHDLMNVSPKFSQVTIGIDNLDMYSDRSRSTSTSSELNLDFEKCSERNSSPTPYHSFRSNPTKAMFPGRTPLEQRLFQTFHLQSLEEHSLVTVDLADALIRISKCSNKDLHFYDTKYLPEMGSVSRTNPYSPVMSIIGRDLLVTFPDFQSILDFVFCDLIGHNFDSIPQIDWSHALFHRGYLRSFPPCLDPVYLRSMQNLIHEHHKISRVLITGTGKGAAVAAIFTLRNAKEILSWTRSISPELVIENLQDNTPNIDLRCITFGCPNFIKCSDISLVDSEISSRIIHMYGEHQLVPLSLTALTSTFGRVGLSVNIKDSKSTFPGRCVKRSSS